MRSRLVVAVSALALSALAATPTWAQEDRRAPVVSAVDISGDVKIRDIAGPTNAQRRSIDLLGLKVVPRGKGVVRFTFRIARVTTSPELDQLLTARFVDGEPGFPEVSGELTLRVQYTESLETRVTVVDEDSEGNSGCVGFESIVVKARGLVKIDLDKVCLPPGQVGIRLKSFTTTPKGSERRVFYSSDFLRVPGSHDVGGTGG